MRTDSKVVDNNASVQTEGRTTSLSRAVAASSYLGHQKKMVAGSCSSEPVRPIPKHVIIGSNRNTYDNNNIASSNCDTTSTKNTTHDDVACDFMDPEKPLRGIFTIYNGEAIPSSTDSSIANDIVHYHNHHPPSSFLSTTTTKGTTSGRCATHITIGTTNNKDDEIMHEGSNISHQYTYDDYSSAALMDVDPLPQPPLVVVDGANVAHSYADCNHEANTSLAISVGRSRKDPDPEGIDIVAKYFMSHGCRVLVVLPSYWLRTKPASQDFNQENALMVTPQLETLQHLQKRGLLCCAPPSDDDDAYAIAIARKAEQSAVKSSTDLFYGHTYLLSNDFFRDAIHRDQGVTGLKDWLTKGTSNGSGPGRISYTFCRIGAPSIVGDEHGQEQLKLAFVPNPRHALIHHIEQRQYLGDSLYE